VADAAGVHPFWSECAVRAVPSVHESSDVLSGEAATKLTASSKVERKAVTEKWLDFDPTRIDGKTGEITYMCA